MNGVSQLVFAYMGGAGVGGWQAGCAFSHQFRPLEHVCVQRLQTNVFECIDAVSQTRHV